MASAATIQPLPSQAVSTASWSIISLEMKPLKGGRPAIDAPATIAMVAVTGISCSRPPRRRMSRVPASWSTMPAFMNSAALKVAWLRMWNTAATAASGVPKPSSMVTRPRWLTVE